MSPSEGLVYKPFGGGFLPPDYGTCGPTNPTALEGFFPNSTYSFPTSHQQGIGISLFGIPLFAMPLMNQSVSSSAVEQASPFDRARSDGQENQLKGGTKRGMSSLCAASKKSEVQGADARSLSLLPQLFEPFRFRINLLKHGLSSLYLITVDQHLNQLLGFSRPYKKKGNVNETTQQDDHFVYASFLVP